MIGLGNFGSQSSWDILTVIIAILIALPIASVFLYLIKRAKKIKKISLGTAVVMCVLDVFVFLAIFTYIMLPTIQFHMADACLRRVAIEEPQLKTIDVGKVCMHPSYTDFFGIF